MARPHVGLAALEGDLERYAEKYDLLELRPGEGAMPKPATLRAWRRKVPPSFAFSVVFPKAVSELKPSAALDAALEQSLAWEPHGIWELDEAEELADKLGVVLVVDAAREPAPKGAIAYFRLRGLGESSRLSPAVVDKVADDLLSRREAYVVIESHGPLAVAETLRKKTARRASPTRAGVAVIKPRATLHAEDEEQ